MVVLLRFPPPVGSFWLVLFFWERAPPKGGEEGSTTKKGGGQAAPPEREGGESSTTRNLTPINLTKLNFSFLHDFWSLISFQFIQTKENGPFTRRKQSKAAPPKGERGSQLHPKEGQERAAPSKGWAGRQHHPTAERRKATPPQGGEGPHHHPKGGGGTTTTSTEQNQTSVNLRKLNFNFANLLFQCKQFGANERASRRRCDVVFSARRNHIFWRITWGLLWGGYWERVWYQRECRESGCWHLAHRKLEVETADSGSSRQ